MGVSFSIEVVFFKLLKHSAPRSILYRIHCEVIGLILCGALLKLKVVFMVFSVGGG